MTPTLAELIDRQIVPESKSRHDPIAQELFEPIMAKSSKPEDQFEAAVFAHLLAKKKELGMKKVLRYSALLVDGAIELSDGRLLAIEIKYRMNWLKACQAEWQFRNFLKRHAAKFGPVNGGLVFFDEFSGDWQQQAQCRRIQDGWNNWYRAHAEVDGMRLNLLRLNMEALEGFPALDQNADCA